MDLVTAEPSIRLLPMNTDFKIMWASILLNRRMHRELSKRNVCYHATICCENVCLNGNSRSLSSTVFAVGNSVNTIFR